MHCQYAGVCGGCPWIGVSLSDQHQQKIKALEGLFPLEHVEVHSPGESRLRDRVDLTIENGRIGLWGLNRELVDINECPMMSQPLEDWFKEFRTRLPNIGKGSVRLRVSSEGHKGAWLDFSNEDVHGLFEEREYLKWLSSKGIVEIGQRKKPLYFDEDGKPKLRKDPDLFPWFQTFDSHGKGFPVYGAIASFTQSGVKANRVLVNEVLKLVGDSGLDQWVEAFCGSGNFTIPLSKISKQVVAIESEELSLRSLKLGLAKSDSKNVEIFRVDLKSIKQTGKWIEDLSLSGKYGLLVDPPRSGMMNLLDQILENHLSPQTIVYVSCFTESLRSDVERLRQMGYHLEKLSLVDQFPHSAHCEWVGLLTKVVVA